MTFFQDQVVLTRAGAVRGHPDAEHTWMWRSIPFAAPPVGELRWKAPRPVEPWAGILDVPDFGHLACQAVPREERDRVSENCLILHVWRPRTQETALPVYVWIHGGGNTVAMPAPASTPGAAIAGRGNMVFVSIQYRLGEFGWFAHPALRENKPESALDDSGNYGTLDIVEALRWIRENIEVFGGDPGNVLVTGESAGAFNTLCLLISPAAQGLFHKIMAQSGRQNTYSIERADRQGQRVLEQLLVDDGSATDAAGARELAAKWSAPETARYLRSKSFVDFLRARRSAGFLAAFEDGAVLHSDGFRSLLDGTYPSRVPAIIGMNKEESKFALSRAQAHRRLSPDVYEGVARYLSDLKKATGADSILRALHSQADQPAVYGYEMLWGYKRADGSSPMPEPLATRVGACHGIDIPFFFGDMREQGIMNVGFGPDNLAGRHELSSAMMRYLAAFAWHDDPNPPGSDLPAWHPWSNEPGAEKAIVLDANREHAEIRMSAEELTQEGVEADLDKIEEPLQGRIREAARWIGRV